jgi:Asp-tRNA(Asn)/Glu-tRNA(Gln) amidotransferase A subunit family amidase
LVQRLRITVEGQFDTDAIPEVDELWLKAVTTARALSGEVVDIAIETESSSVRICGIQPSACTHLQSALESALDEVSEYAIA